MGEIKSNLQPAHESTQAYVERILRDGTVKRFVVIELEPMDPEAIRQEAGIEPEILGRDHYIADKVRPIHWAAQGKSVPKNPKSKSTEVAHLPFRVI